MSSEIGVRLTGDNSEYRSMLDNSVQQGANFAGKLTSKVAGKLFELRDVSRTVATALGLNLESIADNVARWATGVSKDEEEALKQMEAISTQVAETNMRNMKARLTEEQRYQLALIERDRLTKSIAEREVKNAQDRVAQYKDELALSAKIAEIDQQEKKFSEERTQAIEKDIKLHNDEAEQIYKSQLERMTAGQKTKALTEEILFLENAIRDGLFEGARLEEAKVKLKDRRVALTREETEAMKDQEGPIRIVTTLEKVDLDYARERAEAEAKVTAELEAQAKAAAEKVEIARRADAGAPPGVRTKRDAYGNAVFTEGDLVLDENGLPVFQNGQLLRNPGKPIADVGGGSGFDHMTANAEIDSPYLLQQWSSQAEQMIYDQKIREQTVQQIDRQLAALQSEIDRSRANGSRLGQTIIARDESQQQVLRNRRANVDSYLFDPSYSDPMGDGVSRRALSQQSYDELQKQTNALNSITKQLTNVFGSPNALGG